jgi:hypothetical protein
MAGKAKGGAFERDICKRLSLWWTDDERDDVFWRTASSGGRATQRKKKGKDTFGQAGDVQATDPIGQPLINLFTIEIKRGYKEATVTNLLDRLDTEKRPSPFEQFIHQVTTDKNIANSVSWMIIAKRDRKKIMVYMPWQVFKDVRQYCPCYSFITYRTFHLQYKKRIIVTTLEDFFAIPPDKIRSLYA